MSVSRIPALAAAIVSVLACNDSTGPEIERAASAKTPRISEVPAVACPNDTGSYFLCLRDGFPIDPAVNDSPFHITILLPVFRDPPAASWWLMRARVEDRIVGEEVGRLATERMDTAARALQDTVPLGWLPSEHPTLRLELILAEGDDPRFLTRVADTAFVWSGSGSARPRQP